MLAKFPRDLQMKGSVELQSVIIHISVILTHLHACKCEQICTCKPWMKVCDLQVSAYKQPVDM